MKSKIIVCFTLACFAGIAAQAQLLKKLKEKAEKAVTKKTDNGNSSSAAAETGSSSGQQEEKINNTPSAPPANGSIVFTLDKEEKLLYDESAIIVKNNTVNYLFVTVNNKYEYFLIDNGKRTGPFKEAPIKSMKQDDDEESSSGNNDDAVNMGNDKKDPVSIQYSKTINGKLYLVFNGKNFGPYDNVAKMIVSPDKKQFFALVTIGGDNAMTTKMGMGYIFMVNEAGLKKACTASGMGMPAKFSVSAGFKHCMATVIDQKDQKAITVTSAGKQFEANMMDAYSGEGTESMVSDKGDIITIPSQSPTQILVNGTEAASFKVPIKNKSRLFLTPDVSKSVYYENGKIYRADGSEESVKGIVFPKVVTVNNETAMYYYKVYKNDKGDKDVYLCKKIL